MSESTTSPRPSRQELVVPPRQSGFASVAGAILCAAAGFGLVWALGIGRSNADRGVAPTVATSPEPADDAGPHAETSARQEPDMLPLSDDARPSAPSTDDRYPTTPASLDLPEHVIPAAGEQPVPRTSRFAPVDLPAADDTAEPALQPPASAEAAMPPDEPEMPEAASGAVIDSTDATAEPLAADLGEPLPEDTGDLAASDPPPAVSSAAGRSTGANREVRGTGCSPAAGITCSGRSSEAGV
ncbi:MAG: hypothetical protein ACKOC8_00520, partial [Pirellulales bacterium]